MFLLAPFNFPLLRIFFYPALYFLFNFFSYFSFSYQFPSPADVGAGNLNCDVMSLAGAVKFTGEQQGVGRISE
jgi:hypothetical protein